MAMRDYKADYEKLRKVLKDVEEGINRRLRSLEREKERICIAVGELMIKNDKAYDDLPSTVMISIDDSKQNVRLIDRELATLNWTLQLIGKWE